MARIRITDLSENMELSREEMRKILGGDDPGTINFGGREASLQGTGGVALLEYAKDAIQTAVSNISGVGTNQIQARKIVERKLSNMG